MSKDGQSTCLCGVPTGGMYAQGHDTRHASELALAVYAGALSEADAVAFIPTRDTVARYEGNLASRRNGTYRGKITTWGAWLEDTING